MIIKFKNFYPKVHKKSWIAPSADVIGNIKIGKNSSVWFNCVLRADVNAIKIGNCTNIQDLSMIHTDVNNQTIIGNNVTIAHKVMLHGCTIEDNCLIGMSATILDNAVIGRGSIVGANSLVTSGKIFPPNSLILGSPAKVIRMLDNKDEIKLINHAKQYIHFKNEYS